MQGRGKEGLLQGGEKAKEYRVVRHKKGQTRLGYFLPSNSFQINFIFYHNNSVSLNFSYVIVIKCYPNIKLTLFRDLDLLNFSQINVIPEMPSRSKHLN